MKVASLLHRLTEPCFSPFVTGMIVIGVLSIVHFGLGKPNNHVQNSDDDSLSNGRDMLKPVIDKVIPNYKREFEEQEKGRAGPLPVRADIHLAGVEENGIDSAAYLRVNGLSQNRFSIGQEISPGIFLQSVKGDTIVVENQNDYEVLSIKTLQVGTPNIGDPNPDIALASFPELLEENGDHSTRQRRSRSAKERGKVLPAGITQISENQFVVQRAIIEAQLRSPELHKQARIEPIKDKGLYIAKLQEDSLYEMLGFQEGDLIQEVNGQPFQSLFDGLRLFQELDELDKVEFLVTNGNKTEFLYYYFQ